MVVSFEEYNKMEKEVSNYKKNLCEIIDEFVNFDSEFRKNHKIKGYQHCFDFYKDSLRDEIFVIIN